MRRTVQRILLVSAAIGVLAALYLGLASRPTEKIQSADAGVVKERRDPDVGQRVAQNPDGGWPQPTFEGRVLRALLDGEPVAAEFTLGVAGTYPPLRAEGDHAPLPELRPGLDGQEPNVFEVLATAAATDNAFWGLVDSQTEVVELGRAAPLVVKVVDADGKAVPDARVRLALSTVALVSRQARADSGGTATFSKVPEGSYYVTIEATDRLTRAQPVELSGDDPTELEVALERGRSAVGTVRDPKGRPMSDAVVALYVSRGATSLPETVAATRPDGTWAVEGLPEGPTTAVVFADGFAPSSSATVDTTLGTDPVILDVQLQPGITTTVRVVDESRRPVQRATVSWRDPVTGFGASAAALDGTVTLSGVARRALLHAAFADWKSQETDLSLVRDPRNVELVLGRFDASKMWRTRIDAPPGVAVARVEAHDDSGVRCAVETVSERDFTLRGCGPGQLALEITTSAGLVQRSVEAQDGLTIALPKPGELAVRVEGSESTDWEQLYFDLTDGTVSVPFDVSPVTATERRIVASVFPGAWTLRVYGAGEHAFPLSVGEGTTTETVRLEPGGRARLWVTDRHDAPITGAYLMLFENGRLVDTARSGGQLPAEFRRRTPFQGVVLAVDPRRGEGRLDLELTEDDAAVEQRVSLTDALFANSIPPTRVDAAGFEARTGARLVRDAEGFTLDFDRSDAPGLAAGLKRGDKVVTGWMQGGSLRAIVFRSAQGYLDVTIPAR